MSNNDNTVEFSEPVGLAGLEEQWELGDRFALVEAIALCDKNGWEYLPWMKDIINAAMASLYQAAYPNVDLDRLRPGQKEPRAIRINEKELTSRLKRQRSNLLNLLGLEVEKDNFVNIRKRLFRDAYVAEWIARRCKFVMTPKPQFRGVNKAINDLAHRLSLDPNEPETTETFRDECWNASEYTIERAWKKHRDKLIALYRDSPQDTHIDLAWLLFPPSEPD